MALQSVSFNGSSTFISCGVVPTGGLSTITVEAWVYFNSVASATQGIISKDGATSQDWALFTENNTDITFRFKRSGGGTVRVGTYINGAKTGRWQHIVGIYDGGHVYVYVDGVVGITANTATGTVNTSAQAVEIGRYSGGGYLNGKVGYASISNSVRYTAAFTPPSLPRAVDANTLAQWNFTNGSGVIVKNVGYNTSYDGTITSGAWSTATPFFATHVDSGHLIELKVNNVDLWSNTVSKSFRLTEVEGGQTSTATFDIEETSSTYTFLAWTHEVVWLVDGVKEFGGYVVSVSPKVVKGTTKRVYSINCESYQAILNHAPKLRESYVNKTSKQILVALFAAAGMTAFDTSTYVSEGSLWDSFSCNGEKLVDLLDRLAQRERYAWRIDAEKHVRFGAAAAFTAPFGVTEVSLANLSSTYPVIDSPEYKYDQTDIRNRIKIIGGTRVSSIITDTFTGDGATLMFQLTHHPIYDVLYVTVNEALQRHGVDWYVTFDDGYDCLINYRSGTIRWNPHTPPENSSEIVVCYRQLLEFNHTCTSAASYQLYGMYFDYELADASITSEYMAEQVCTAMLADYEYGRFEGSFTVERFGLHVGQQILVNFPTLGINANYTVRQVSTEVLKGDIISCQIKYGGKRLRVQQIPNPSTNTGGGMGGAVPIQSGGGTGGSGGGVPGASWGGGEVDIVRVNKSIEAIKRTTQFNNFSDYGTATGIVLAYDNVSDTAKLLGLNGGELQAYFDSYGGIKGGGGAIIIDDSGLRVVSPIGSPGPSQEIRFASADGTDTYAEWYTFMNLASMDSWLIVSAADHPVSAHAIFNLQANAASGKYGQIYIDAIGDNNNEHATINLVADVGATSIELIADTVQVIAGASFDKGITVNETGVDSDTRMEGDTATNLFVLDAGLDAVQIGTTTAGVIADFRSSGIVLNENGADRDLRVEGDTDANLFFVDASTDRVGIGTTNPGAKLDISAGNLDLDTTTNTNQFGVISKDGARFIHNFNYGNNGTVTTEGANTFVGLNAGNLTMGSTATQTYQASYNTALGQGALYSNTTGYINTASGYFSLYSNTTGFQNTASGYASLSSNTTGFSNTASGYASLSSNTTGSQNTASGLLSLYSNTTGYSNTASGYEAGRYISGGSGANATSTNSLYLGALTKALADGDTNEIVLGYDTTGFGSHTVAYGNSSMTKHIFQAGNVGIGTTNPGAKLDVAGEVRLGSSSNYVKIDTTGHLTMNGDATQWGSVFVSPFCTKATGAVPTDEMFPYGGSANLAAYGFQKETYTELFFFAQIPPSYKIDTGIIPVIHFSPADNCSHGETPLWGMEFTVGNYSNTFTANNVFSSATYTPIEDLVQDRHYKVVLSEITGTITNGAIIAGRIFRDGKDSSDTAMQTMIFLGLEFVFEMDSIGLKTSTNKT